MFYKVEMAKTLERGFDINERYSKLSQREHILRRPDTYVGGTDLLESEMWVWDEEQSRICRRKVSYPPALLKIFDEILVNSRDHSVRDESCTRIRVELDRETGCITVENNGDGIAVEQHDEGCMLPELIFGRFRAGENFSDEEQKIVGGRNGLGSKLCVIGTTPIPTWDGDMKHACELTLDDKLIGDDGTVRHITGITRGFGKMYEVSQGRKGESYQVNDKHILTLHMPDHKVIFWDASKNGWSVLWWDHDANNIKAKTEGLGTPGAYVVCKECGTTLSGNLKRHYSHVHKGIEVPETERRNSTQPPETEEALVARERLEAFCKTIPDDNTIDISIQDYIKLSKTAQLRLAGIRGDCVQWPHREVYFDPYLLGLWFGDGFKAGRGLACDESTDPETLDYLQQWCEKNDGLLNKTGHCAHYIASRSNVERCTTRHQNPLKKKLEAYDLVNNKHIPEDYLVNDRDTRLKVLAGIIDSDGTVNRDGTKVSIAQGMMHQRLAEDITFLVRSLGFFCSKSVHKTTWTYKGEKKHGQCYKMRITGDLEDIPTRLPRKKCANGKKHSAKTTGKITVREIKDADYVGVSVDGNRRFLINDFTVTHNCNVFSSRFEVDTVDKFTHKRYMQVWEKNMEMRHDPVVTSCRKAPYTKITFTPDYARLGGVDLKDDNIFALLKRRVYDMAACTREQVLIYLNGEKLAVRNFEKYINLYLGDSKSAVPRVYAKLKNDGEHLEIKEWQLGVALSEEGFKQVSFVNGIATSEGGTHVNYLRDKLVRKLGKLIREKNPTTPVKPAYIRENIMLFVNAVVVNPAFSSQVKETLTSKPDSFGFKHTLSPELVDQIERRLRISKIATKFAELRKPSTLKSFGGRKKKKLHGILKLEDAEYAGTSRSGQCTLILTEGDSAKTMAMDGLQIIGRDYYGVYPLKGKPLNARNASDDQLAKNEEFTAFMKIMGLQVGVEYKDASELRYGSIMLMTDQDLDGFHIKGIKINNILHMWPSLLNIPGFIKCFVTPIVKLQPTNPRSRVKEQLFFNMSEFEAYRTGHPDGLRGMKVRYLKGLGSSEPKEARAYFADFSRFVKEYRPTSDSLDTCRESFEHAFSDTFADWRKKWLEDYDEELVYDYTRPVFSLEQYADRELKHFSIYDNQRSLGHVCDGLKISQRKALWALRQLGLWNETKKVLALAGEVSSRSSYHHGEKSMMDTMIGMAQPFVGSNNCNYFYPSGQFGCLDPDTPVLTHTMERKLARDVVVGDLLLGDDGLPRKVLDTVEGMDEMFDVRQEHGETYRVNSEHILTLSFSLHKVIYWKASTGRWTMEYLDHKNGSIRSKSLSTTKSTHYNSSKEAYEKMVDFAKAIPDNKIIDISVKNYLRLPAHQKKRLRGLVMPSLRITGKLLNKIPVRLARKAISSAVGTKETPYETRFHVTPVGRGRFVGWQVDGNERFLLGDFTVTHNSRLRNGKDASDARYIHTRLNHITKHIFRAEDDAVLRYEVDDEGKQIEPKHFVPIIATVLLNGCNGIGTGYSTDVPMYHPLQVIDAHLSLLEDRALPSLVPWYRGYRGMITDVKGQVGSFYSTGIYERINDTTVRVTEVPVGQSFDGYKEFLEKHLMENAPTSTTKTGKRKAMDKKFYFIKEYSSQTFPSRCNYTISFADKATVDGLLEAPESSKGILKKLRLRSTIHTRNMHLFTENGAIRRFTSPEDIIQHHAQVRLKLYAKRKAYQLETLAEKIAALDRKSRFMKLVLDGTIETKNRPKREIAEALREHNLVDQNEMEIEGDVLTPSMKALLRISLLDMTEEEVAKFLRKIEELKEEWASLEATSPTALWITELKSLRNEMEKFLEAAALDDEISPTKAEKQPKKKRAVKRKRKKKVTQFSRAIHSTF